MSVMQTPLAHASELTSPASTRALAADLHEDGTPAAVPRAIVAALPLKPCEPVLVPRRGRRAAIPPPHDAPGDPWLPLPLHGRAIVWGRAVGRSGFLEAWHPSAVRAAAVGDGTGCRQLRHCASLAAVGDNEHFAGLPNVAVIRGIVLGSVGALDALVILPATIVVDALRIALRKGTMCSITSLL